jgi:hypothetical protein
MKSGLNKDLSFFQINSIYIFCIVVNIKLTYEIFSLVFYGYIKYDHTMCSFFLCIVR